MGIRILIVDDEESIRELLEIMLKREGHVITTAENGQKAMSLFKKQMFDIVISDIQMPVMNGLELLENIKSQNEEIPIIMITAFGTIETAVQAMKLGAFDYITKPFKIDEIKIVIKKALENRNLKIENTYLRKEMKVKFGFQNIIGNSPLMQKMFSLIQRVAENKTNILITGESGTGKELIAKAIHFNGPLKERPFVTINCGAIPENLIESEMFGHKKGSFTGAISDKLGLFETANGGTIFLDEVGELPLTIQVKLLRAIQEKTFKMVGGVDDIQVDVRVIAATNRKMEELVGQGLFREDLYYRLNVIQINSPALRQRKDDIEILANHFLEKFCKEFKKGIKKISNEAMSALLKHDFPGNVRELENIIERAVALEQGPTILPESLPVLNSPRKLTKVQKNPIPEISEDGIDLESIVGAIERELLEKALAKSGGVKKDAARLLKISFRSMRYRLEKYQMDSTDEAA